ncbi:MAG: bifunctional oligoribonuclease/PAP phosphatase NrnA [Lachnospiraceae bacterium]|jgi:phosphoesterase RecJ-like protein|nr:bifunctional oligoribonuclease/PAP phosphatase NrnA [Lachnospiraceae bacterium]
MGNVEFIGLIEKANSIALGGHIRPDGDATGSTMGLSEYIRTLYPEKKVDVYLEEIPPEYHFLKGTDLVKHECTQEVYDLFICEDCGDAKRLGFSMKAFEKAKDTICIDHHISNQSFAAHNFIDPDASSTSEIVFRLIDKSVLNKDIAECLFLGIVHDTGVFQYACTAPETLEAAAVLLRFGIDAPKIIFETYYQKTYSQLRITGKALESSRLIENDTCIVSQISYEDQTEYHVTPMDLDGIVSQLRLSKEAKLAVFFYETAPGEWKISLRCVDGIDVSLIAGHFGGGGHVLASGFSTKKKPDEMLALILEQFRLQLV